MQKPKTFAIKGTELLLRAFYEELLKMGYSEGYYTFDNARKKDFISTYLEVSDILEINKFKELYVNDTYGENCFKHHHATFQLPEQFNEALNFAKEQLNNPYWKMLEFEEDALYLVRWKSHDEIDTARYSNGYFKIIDSTTNIAFECFSKIQKIEIPKDF